MKNPTPRRTAESNIAGDIKNSSTSLEQAIALATGPHTAQAPYLGDLDVVHNLVSVFLGEELQRILAVSDDELSEEDAQQQTLASVHHYVRIFSGQDNNYTSMPGWHTTSTGLQSLSLLDVIRRERGLPATTTDEHTLQTFFVASIMAVREAVRQLAITGDSEQLNEALQKRAETDAHLLLGMHGLSCLHSSHQQ